MNLNRRNVVLAALAVALAVPTALQLRADAETFVDISRVPLLFDGFTTDNLGSIRLRQPKADATADASNPGSTRVAFDELLLLKTDKGWQLGPGMDLAGAPVAKERIEADVLQHLRTIRADKKVLVQADATPAQLAEVGLDEAQAFVVQANDAENRNVIADLLVGRDAGVGQTGSEAVRGVYVRKSDSTDVILYEFDQGWRRDVKPELWLDKLLARLQPDKIHKLSLRNAAGGGATFRFERKDGKASWQAIDPPADVGAVRQSEIETLVQRLAYLAAQDIRAPLPSNLVQLGLEPPVLALELEVKDGDRDRVLQLGIGNKVDGKNEYYLRCNESAFLMTWAAGNVVPFEVDVKAQWFDPAPPK